MLLLPISRAVAHIALMQIYVTSDCLFEVKQMRHSEEDFVIRIPKKPAAISALFFFERPPVLPSCSQHTANDPSIVFV